MTYFFLLHVNGFPEKLKVKNESFQLADDPSIIYKFESITNTQLKIEKIISRKKTRRVADKGSDQIKCR